MLLRYDKKCNVQFIFHFQRSASNRGNGNGVFSLLYKKSSIATQRVLANDHLRGETQLIGDAMEREVAGDRCGI